MFVISINLYNPSAWCITATRPHSTPSWFPSGLHSLELQALCSSPPYLCYLQKRKGSPLHWKFTSFPAFYTSSSWSFTVCKMEERAWIILPCNLWPRYLLDATVHSYPQLQKKTSGITAEGSIAVIQTRAVFLLYKITLATRQLFRVLASSLGMLHTLSVTLCWHLPIFIAVLHMTWLLQWRHNDTCW